MEKTCPRCGKTEKQKPFIGFFCEDCYSQNSNVKMEHKVRFVSCNRCGRLQMGNGWVEFSRKTLDEKLKQFASGQFDAIRFVLPEKLEGESLAVFIIKSGSSIAEVSREFILARDWGICTVCSRQSSGYFESIIQVRCPTPEENERLTKKLVTALERKTFLAKIEELKEGIDLYVGSNKTTMEVIEKLGLKFLKTYTLHTADKEGKGIYRTTYCLRKGTR